MAYEATVVALAVVIITAVLAWYFRLFDKEEEDLEIDEGAHASADDCSDPPLWCSDVSLEALQEKMRALKPEEADGYGG